MIENTFSVNLVDIDDNFSMNSEKTLNPKEPHKSRKTMLNDTMASGDADDSKSFKSSRWRWVVLFLACMF